MEVTARGPALVSHPAMAQVDVACERRASRHHGVLSRASAKRLGMSTTQIRYRLRSGSWKEIFPGIYFLGATRPTWEARLAGAVMFAGRGSAVAGRAAAAHLGLDGCRKGPVEVVSPAYAGRAPFRCH